MANPAGLQQRFKVSLRVYLKEGDNISNDKPKKAWGYNNPQDKPPAAAGQQRALATRKSCSMHVRSSSAAPWTQSCGALPAVPWERLLAAQPMQRSLKHMKHAGGSRSMQLRSTSRTSGIGAQAPTISMQIVFDELAELKAKHNMLAWRYKEKRQEHAVLLAAHEELLQHKGELSNQLLCLRAAQRATKQALHSAVERAAWHQRQCEQGRAELAKERQMREALQRELDRYRTAPRAAAVAAPPTAPTLPVPGVKARAPASSRTSTAAASSSGCVSPASSAPPASPASCSIPSAPSSTSSSTCTSTSSSMSWPPSSLPVSGAPSAAGSLSRTTRRTCSAAASPAAAAGPTNPHPQRSNRSGIPQPQPSNPTTTRSPAAKPSSRSRIPRPQQQQKQQPSSSPAAARPAPARPSAPASSSARFRSRLPMLKLVLSGDAADASHCSSACVSPALPLPPSLLPAGARSWRK